MSSNFKTGLFSMLRRCTLGARRTAIKLNLLEAYTAVYEKIRLPVYLFLRPKGIIKIKARGMEWFVDAEDRVIAADLMTFHVWEPEEAQLIQDAMTPGAVMIDIGANIGYHALHAAKVAGPQGKVYAFEPDPHNFDLLKRNIEVNQSANVTAVPCAVSDKTQNLKLYLSLQNFGAHSITQDNVMLGKGKAVDIQAYSLDEFCTQNQIPRVDLIKMDTQGAEGLILSGASQVLQKNKNLKIIMEFWPLGLRGTGSDPLEVLRLLQRNGFQLSALINGKVSPLENNEKTIQTAEQHQYLTLICKRP